MSETVEARVEHTFKASPERVFDAWLNEDLVRQWMSAALKGFGLSGEVRRIEIDARVGGKFTFSDMREGAETVHWGTYLEIDRPRKLVFSWFTSEKDEKADSSVVSLTIEPAGSGCVATIVHILDVKYAEYIPRVEMGWGGMLNETDVLLQSR